MFLLNRHCLQYETKFTISWDTLENQMESNLNYDKIHNFEVYSDPIYITTHTKYFTKAHPTAFWDAHFGNWDSKNPGIFIVPKEVQWKTFVEKLDLWFSSKTGRKLLPTCGLQKPDVKDYLTTRLLNRYEKRMDILKFCTI